MKSYFHNLKPIGIDIRGLNTVKYTSIPTYAQRINNINKLYY